MADALAVNGVALFCAVALGFLFGADGERPFWAFWAGALVFNLSLLGWIVYVVAHFAAKWW